MTERRGGQPGPEQGSGARDRRVIRGAELDQLKATRPGMADSRFALEWRDEQGRLHLGYNYRRTTVDRDGNERTLFHYNNPPTFESTYADWRVGTAYEVSPDGERPLGELYTLYLNMRSRQGREALNRFLHEADEAGYSATRWLPNPRDRAVSQDGSPVTSLTYLLKERPPTGDPPSDPT